MSCYSVKRIIIARLSRGYWASARGQRHTHAHGRDATICQSSKAKSTPSDITLIGSSSGLSASPFPRIRVRSAEPLDPMQPNVEHDICPIPKQHVYLIHNVKATGTMGSRREICALRTFPTRRNNLSLFDHTSRLTDFWETWKRSCFASSPSFGTARTPIPRVGCADTPGSHTIIHLSGVSIASQAIEPLSTVRDHFTPLNALFNKSVADAATGLSTDNLDHSRLILIPFGS